MATFNSAGSGNFNADATWTESGQPSTDDVAVIASGHTVTMTADASVGSIDIQGTLTTDGTARTLTLDDGGQGYICEHRGTVSTTINLTINSNYEGNRLIRLNNGGNGNFNDVSITLQSSARVLEYVQNTTIDGDLTINMGEFQHYSSTYSLTVTKACTVGNSGKLDLGSATVSLGTLNVNNSANAAITFSSATTTITLNPNSTHPTWGFSLGAAATVNFNGGTIKFAKVDSGTRYMQMGAEGTHVLNDVIVDTNYDIPWAGFFEAASLDIQDGNLNSYGGSTGITISGDLTVGNGTDAASLGYTSDSNGFHDQKFGSVLISANGTLNGSNQTTTITGKESGACFDNSGTFTHNNGTVSFTKSGGTWTTIFNSGGQSFYDVNVDSSTGQAIYANDPLTILNNFTLVRGTFIANAASSHDGDITVRGLTTIGGGANATKLENDGRTLQLENVTVLSNGTIDVAEGTNNFGGIRNVGGTIT